MNVREWSLVIFTVLGQMSVGSFLVLLVVYFFVYRKYGVEEADRMNNRALYAIGPVLILSIIASILHLGNVSNAYRAVANIASSWLSREIFFVLLFAVLAGIFGLLQWRKIGPVSLRMVIAVLAALAGIALIWSMSSIYLLATQPAWNIWATPVNFALTTLLLGILAMGAAYVANYAYLQRTNPDCAETQCEILRNTLRGFAIAIVVLLGVELVVAPLHIAYLAVGASPTAIASVEALLGDFPIILALRLALAFVGAGVLGVFLYRNAMSPGHEKALANLSYAAFGFVFVAEILGRYLFYATQVSIGI
jgi:anaerobic dimethyl sulfoxide reductase subunit C (anchor subunit)